MPSVTLCLNIYINLLQNNYDITLKKLKRLSPVLSNAVTCHKPSRVSEKPLRQRFVLPDILGSHHGLWDLSQGERAGSVFWCRRHHLFQRCAQSMCFVFSNTNPLTRDSVWMWMWGAAVGTEIHTEFKRHTNRAVVKPNDTVYSYGEWIWGRRKEGGCEV